MPRPSKGPRLWFDDATGLWYVRDGTRKRGTGCGAQEREGAEKALAEYIAEKYEPPREGAALLVADVLTFYAREFAASHRSTATSYAIERLVEWWGSRPITDIRASTCRAYVEHRTSSTIPQAKRNAAKARPISTATAARELTVLRAAVNAWHAETPLAALPVVTIPPLPEGRQRWVTRDEAARLLRGARTVEHPDARRALIRFILVALYTGTRSGAIRALAWHPNTLGGWFDLDRQIMHRRADGEIQTKKRKPSVRIPDRLMPFLRRWRAEDLASGRAFVVTYRGEPMDAQRRAWTKAREAAGLGADVVPHTLRHTAATWMMHARIPVVDAADYLGMSVDLFWSTYRHAHPDHQTETASRIGRR